MLFGGEVIRGFTIAMTFGVVVGMYSSIIVGGPILIYFGLKARADTPEEAKKAKAPTAPRSSYVIGSPGSCPANPISGFMADRPQMNDTGHYPTQVGLDAYGNGGFRFAGMSHRGSLLCLPTGMHAWAVTTPAEITLQSLEPVFAAADDIDVLLIGLGTDITGLDPAIRAALRERRIIVEAIATGGAVAPIMCCWPKSVPSPRP